MKKLTAKDFWWIVVVTLIVVAAIPLIAGFGAIMQICFVILMPIAIIVATVQAFKKPKQ